MADLTSNFIGIKSPNPFWLASAPPTDKEYNVRRAFEAGWGGVVWKTLGSEGPPVVNVNGPRYGAIYGADRRLLGLNNIELITDRDLFTNLEEIKRVKADYPVLLQAGDREADTQYYRHPQTRRCGQAGRGRCGQPDQHHQFDYIG